MAEQPLDRWAKFKDRVKDAARFPLVVLVIFASGMLAWLGCWTVWRVSEYVFRKYLEASWLS